MKHHGIILLLFFISGFTALVLEVVWAKEACLIFGNTTFAYASVIAAFMGGLAIGSYAFGKVADHKPEESLKFYGILEAGIGIFALCFPLILAVLHPLYKALYLNFQDSFILLSLLRFGLSFLILLPPTILMGGTFPLLCKVMSDDESTLGSEISRLYALNLFGAMTGSFLSGFVLLGTLGIRKTTILAACLNLAVFFIVMILNKHIKLSPSKRPSAAKASPITSPIAKVLLVFVLIHGVIAFVIQIAWTRLMILVLGSSTYAFSAILTTFLAGLGLGTYQVALLKRKGNITPFQIGMTEILMGISILLFIPFFEWLIYLFVLLSPAFDKSVTMIFVVQFLICILAMIVPTYLLGIIYPAVLSFLANAKEMGQIAGKSYAFNTFGGVLGCAAVAFLLIPLLGLVGTLRFASFMGITSACFLIFMTTDKLALKPHMPKVIILVIIGTLLMFCPWNKNLFVSGVYAYASDYRGTPHSGWSQLKEFLVSSNRMLYYKEGISSTVCVLEYDVSRKDGLPVKALRVNGKTDATTSGDMASQLYLALAPLFAHPDPKDVLIIGLGSGITAGVATHFDTIKNIEIVEIEPAVIEANKFFRVESHAVLEDPRVSTHVGDGRNHISFSAKKYDVIISEPSNPWMSGVSNLFTLENFRQARDKLRKNGIFCQWFHAYQMSNDDFFMIMETFARSFAHVNLFRVNKGDYFLLGSNEPITFDSTRIRNIIRQNKDLQNDLKEFSHHGSNIVEGSFLLKDRDLRSLLSRLNPKVNTDDLLYLEYSAPKRLYQPWNNEIFKILTSQKQTELGPQIHNRRESPEQRKRRMGDLWLRNASNAFENRNLELSLYYLKNAEEFIPDKYELLLSLGKTHESLGNFSTAMKYYRGAQDVSEDSTMILKLYKRITLRQEAINNPELMESADFHNELARLSYLAEDYLETERELLLAIDLAPTEIKHYIHLSHLYSTTNMFKKLIELDERIKKLGL
jgi:spermidine synthase